MCRQLVGKASRVDVARGSNGARSAAPESREPHALGRGTPRRLFNVVWPVFRRTCILVSARVRFALSPVCPSALNN